MSIEQVKTVIIVAGGKGLRMGGELPKQFMLLSDKPILMHTIERFRKYENSINIIVVLPKSQQDYWRELCKVHSFEVCHKVADGGETRFHSVRNGLEISPKVGLIAIHDGVRPFVSEDVIERAFAKAETSGAVIPLIPVWDSVRERSPQGLKAVDRDNYKLVQTPQVFRAELIHEAYSQEYNAMFTDDASVVEANGYTIDYVEGNRENIKITTPFDLKIAEVLTDK